MKKFKKVLLPILAVILLISTCTFTSCGIFDSKGIDPKKEKKSHEAFINSLGGVSDTYAGSVSDTFYPSDEQAAYAYVSEQVAGLNRVSVIGTSPSQSLTQVEIDAMNLSAEDRAGILDVSAIDVTISTNDDTLSNDTEADIVVLDTLNTTKTVKVYIIKYSDGFKYYSPCPVNGDTITKGYYDSVFNSEKYKNCTYSTKTTITEQVSLLGFFKVDLDITTSQLIRFAENAIYIEQKTESSMLGQGDKQETYAYILQDEAGQITNCYVSTNGTDWNPGDLTAVGFTSAKELVPFYDQYLDYTYFTKTDYGFELAEENSKRYVDQTLSELAELGAGDFDIEMFSKYYVCEGTLSGMRMEMYMNFSIPTGQDGKSVNADAVALTETKISDCGKTVVTLPFDVNN